MTLLFLMCLCGYFLKLKPSSAKAILSLAIAFGPIPCKAAISFSVNLANSNKVDIFILANALLAGAEINERNPDEGLRSLSQIEQVGQSLDL